MGWLGWATFTTWLHAAITGNCSPLRTSAMRRSCRMLSRRKVVAPAPSSRWEGERAAH